MKNNLNFSEIFNEDGLYISYGNFSEGVALQVKDGILSLIEYENPTDLFPKKLDLVVSRTLVNDFKYIQVLNKKQLWYYSNLLKENETIAKKAKTQSGITHISEIG